jgi:hypothetical protein
MHFHVCYNLCLVALTEALTSPAVNTLAKGSILQVLLQLACFQKYALMGDEFSEVI